MGSAALKPSAVVGRLLRKRRQALRLTLREVSERMADRGDRIPTSTLARIEQGKLDPGVRRLHLLLRLYEVPPHLVADLVELEHLAIDPPLGGDLETLYREGVEHWKRGDVAQGLAYLFAVREHVPDDDAGRLLRQKATLTFAVAARNLGKFRLGKQIVDELLCERLHPSLRVNALVLAASLWRGLGSLDVALALVHQASRRLESDTGQEAAWVLHQEAKLLLEDGRREQAERSLERSLESYRASGDVYGEASALVLRVRLLEQRGELPAALECARDVIRIARRHDHARLVATGRLELGRLLVRTGAVDEGLDALTDGLGQAVLLKDRNLQFSAHYSLWKTHEALGDRDRARFERESAKYHVRFIDDVSPEVDEVRALLGE